VLPNQTATQQVTQKHSCPLSLCHTNKEQGVITRFFGTLGLLSHHFIFGGCESFVDFLHLKNQKRVLLSRQLLIDFRFNRFGQNPHTLLEKTLLDST
jgi:hypothetical protein